MTEIKKRVQLAVDCIVLDLVDRAGFDNLWAMIGEDIQQEIIERWRELVTQPFSGEEHLTDLTIQLPVQVCEEYPNCIHCSERIARAKR